MNFAEIGYIKDDESLWISRFIQKLPKPLQTKYLMAAVPLKTDEVTMLGQDGLKITLPITKNEENQALRVRVLKKACALLMEKNIKVILNPDNIAFPFGFMEAKGGLANAIFADQLLKIAAHTKNIDLATAEVVLIDGYNFNTVAVLEAIKAEVNHLSIYTCRKEGLKDILNSIYEETGLIIECFSSPKSTLMSEGDVIINCSADMENYDYAFKRGSVFIEASGYLAKVARMIQKRTDLFFVTNFKAIVSDEDTDARGIEALIFIKNSDLYDAMKGKCLPIEAKKILGYIHKPQMIVKQINR
ncbi:MAG: hypothetical protein AB7E42_01890 [Anaerotignaceae bacterium]